MRRVAAILIATFALIGSAVADPIRVGVTAGPHAEIMEVVKKVAAGRASTFRWWNSPTM
jgi:D-methionine transport system substrate-binding protein